MKRYNLKLHIVIIILLIACIPSIALSESIRFAVLGDTRSGNVAVNEEIFSKIVSQILNFDPPVEFVIVVGDLVSGHSEAGTMDEQFAEWKKIAEPWYESETMIGKKVYLVPGNHDQGIFSQQAWVNAFDYLPDNGPKGEKYFTYSFEFGPVHFSVVNTSSPFYAHRLNYDWLKDDLEATDKPIKLVFGHEPAYPTGPHLGSSLDKYPSERDKFWQLLVDENVKAYFCGHEHLYDHWIKDNVHQIITGGAGAPGPLAFHYLIVDADENDVTVSVYKVLSGTLKEQYKLSQTEDVPNEDRTETGSADWLINNIPCAWMAIIPITLFYFSTFITVKPKQKDTHRLKRKSNCTKNNAH